MWNGALGASSHSAQNTAQPTHPTVLSNSQSRSPFVRAATPSTMPSTPAPPDVPLPRSRTPSPHASRAGHAVTELLRAWGAGDSQASDSLVRLGYGEVRRHAARVARPP